LRARVRPTEDALRKAGVDYVVGRASCAESARGRIIGGVDGFLKLIFRRDDLKPLGVHTIANRPAIWSTSGSSRRLPDRMPASSTMPVSTSPHLALSTRPPRARQR